ncbi:formate dehydrogenase subunit gamma [Paraferrimonas sedimenticola]|uniref:Formate dehydrogenase subunit gamma n=1 Tax=Paraferrimonas sedimenticola TaxID=375674 RepID=A0AA37RZ04_9GAMM|nr:formate dehydrogenase subunit gamma [Paraferrimonas sedimenticola]GLP97559.1 formate dehydrogenase subunit gamma [Paraferrimonas sedimenticola]
MNKLFNMLVMSAMLLVSGFAIANGDAETTQSQAHMWQAIQEGQQGVTTSQSTFHDQLINVNDERLIPARETYLAPGIMLAVFGMIAAFAVFIAVNGISKLHGGFSGKMVYRWSKFDVFIHWLGAIPCLLLILTGIALLAGRFFIQPYLGDGAWSSLVYLSKEIHDVMAIPFIIGWAVMVVLWAKNQMPAKYDLGWILVVGGYINFGPFKGKHPDAGFANAGEKMWFWTFAFVGALVVASGVVLLFPNLIEPSRSLSMLAVVVHGAGAIIIAAFSIIHIFMATVMSEGGMECMVSGYCDENWAKQHHNVWYDEIKADGTLKYKD